VTVALYTLVGFWVLPALARSIGQRKLSELLHRQVSIAQVRLNPYALSATVRGLRIVDRDGARDLFTLKEVYVNLGIASVFKGGVVVQQVRVVEPRLDLVRIADDRYNFSDIVDDLSSGSTASPPINPRVRFYGRSPATNPKIWWMPAGVPTRKRSLIPSGATSCIRHFRIRA